MDSRDFREFVRKRTKLPPTRLSSPRPHDEWTRVYLNEHLKLRAASTFEAKVLPILEKFVRSNLHPVHRIVAKSILDVSFSLSIQSVYIFNPPRIESVLHLAGGRVFIPWSFSRFLESSWSTVIEFPVLKIGRRDYER